MQSGEEGLLTSMWLVTPTEKSTLRRPVSSGSYSFGWECQGQGFSPQLRGTDHINLTMCELPVSLILTVSAKEKGSEPPISAPGKNTQSTHAGYWWWLKNVHFLNGRQGASMCIYKYRHPLVFLHSTLQSSTMLSSALNSVNAGVNCLNPTPCSKLNWSPTSSQFLPWSLHFPTYCAIDTLNIPVHLSGVLFPLCKCVLFPAVWSRISPLTLLNLSFCVSKRRIMLWPHGSVGGNIIPYTKRRLWVQFPIRART